MISNKKMLRYYMRQDAIALGRSHKRYPNFFGDEIWKFERLLRRLEYFDYKRTYQRGGVIFYIIYFDLNIIVYL